jgi:hypothetical protein
MKSIALMLALASFALAAVAADKAPTQMTDQQMEKLVAGTGSAGLFINGDGKGKVSKSCSWSMNGSGSYWYTCF